MALICDGQESFYLPSIEVSWVELRISWIIRLDRVSIHSMKIFPMTTDFSTLFFFSTNFSSRWNSRIQDFYSIRSLFRYKFRYTYHQSWETCETWTNINQITIYDLDETSSCDEMKQNKQNKKFHCRISICTCPSMEWEGKSSLMIKSVAFAISSTLHFRWTRNHAYIRVEMRVRRRLPFTRL
jgi:hypothetical protein